MAKILFFFPKLEHHKDYHYMPISALAVSAELLAQGHKVSIFDQRVDDDKILLPMVKEAEQVLFSCYTGYQLSQGYKLARTVKETFPNKKIILGGPHASALPEQCLRSLYIDEVIVGDIDTGMHPLPYHLIDPMKYINPETERAIYISSYSCVGSCTFCQTTPRRKLLFLPFERVERDIDNLMSLYPYKQMVIFDATLFTKPERALFVARLMKKHGLRWICDSRADEICRMPIDILDEIMASNLVQLTVGMETGSQRITELMKKGKNHLEKYKQCAKILNDYDVKLVSGCIFGCPGEGPEDILQTVDYIKEIREINNYFRISSTFYRPLPGTEMAEMCKSYGYEEPQSLEAWAELGQQNHYEYNSWHDSPWIVGIDEYRKIYEQFRKEYKELFV